MPVRRQGYARGGAGECPPRVHADDSARAVDASWCPPRVVRTRHCRLGDIVKTSEEAYEKDQWVETQYATYRPLAPTFDLNDIAHSLAQVNRYNGHGRFPFSVATHSVLVSLLMEEVTGGDPFEGLYHDGTEAYLADVAAPIKPLLPDWKALDGKAELLLRK